MLHKRFDILDAKADVETGMLEATVAVFNNVDFGGDRILPGAFTKSLEAWRASGDPIPVIFNHDWADANAHIGIAHPDDVVETDKGLFVKAHLDVEDNQVAKQVHKLLKRRSIKEFSFGYDVPKGGQKRAKDGANELSEVTLFEVGPTLKGMNPATELHAVKSAVEEENKPPPDEAEIRKELERHKADEAAEDVPEVEPGPSEVEVLSQTVQQLATHVLELQRQVQKASEPPTEGQIRDELIKHQVSEETEGLPKGDPPPNPIDKLVGTVEALHESVAGLQGRVEKALEKPPTPPPTEQQIRHELIKQKVSEETKDVPKGDPPPSATTVLAETAQKFERSMTDMTAQIAKALEKPPDPPSTSQIRQELVKHTVAEETKDVPKGAPPPPPVEILSQHVEALTDQIGEMARTLDEKLKALEVAVEEPKRANSAVDQRFRKEAAMTVVEVDSDGASFSKPPKQEPEPEREAEWSLKARARREIYELLED